MCVRLSWWNIVHEDGYIPVKEFSSQVSGRIMMLSTVGEKKLRLSSSIVGASEQTSSSLSKAVWMRPLTRQNGVFNAAPILESFLLLYSPLAFP